MKSKMFLLGRLMGLADCLHRNYCIIERNKETLKTHTKPIPGQLMGSAVYQTALQRPKEALKMLFGKMQIYINWASANPDSQSGWIDRIFALYQPFCVCVVVHLHFSFLCCDLGTDQKTTKGRPG